MSLFARTQDPDARGGAVRRELLIFGACLAAGILLVPWCIFIVGRYALGAYGNGGPLAFWGDYLRGLASLRLSFWIAALGPYVLLGVLRAALAALHRPQPEAAAAPAAPARRMRD